MGRSEGVVGISGSGNRATVTSDGWLDVKTHSSDKCFADDYAGAQTAAVIITPTSGKKMIIKQIFVSSEAINVDVTLAFGTSGNVFYKLYTAKTQTHAGNIICAESAIDETIKLTCGAKTFVSIAYDER